MLRGDEPLHEPLRRKVLALVTMRRQYPVLGREDWDWGRVVDRLLPDEAPNITELMFDLIESGSVIGCG